MRPRPSAVSGLYDHTGYWINRFRGEVHTQFERRLAAHDMTVSQWTVLVTVYHGKADTVRNIARIVRLDGGAITRLANRLEARGLIRRRPDPDDGRSVRLELTQKGRTLVPALSLAADETDEQFTGVLSDIEIVRFKKLLAKLLRGAGDSPDPRWIDAPLKRGMLGKNRDND